MMTVANEHQFDQIQGCTAQQQLVSCVLHVEHDNTTCTAQHLASAHITVQFKFRAKHTAQCHAVNNKTLIVQKLCKESVQLSSVHYKWFTGSQTAKQPNIDAC